MKTLIPFLVLTLLAGCDTSSDKTPEQIQAEVAASQKKFALERERIEQENRAREARIAEQRSFVGASFVSVDSNRLEVLLRNNTDKSIDNQSGSLEIFDADDNYVTGIALTNWVPGDVYLPVGASARAIKSLELETTEQRDKIIAGAPNYQYHFTIHKIQFVDEDEINFLDSPVAAEVNPTEKPPVDKSEPVNPNQASPEPCAENQLSIETDEQHYPGSQCSHMERNIDSERFKQEYIQLCRIETGAESAPASAARVQLSSCMKAPGGQGIVYRKRICCDVPWGQVSSWSPQGLRQE